MVTNEQIKEVLDKFDAMTSTELRELGSIKHWKEFSLTEGQSEEDIRFCAIVDAETNSKVQPICFSYISEHQTMTDDFVKELMFLTSGLYSREAYTPENIEIVANIISVYNIRKRNIFEQWNYIDSLVGEGKISKELKENLSRRSRTNPIYDRLDWYGILKNSRLLSPEFMQKFSGLLSVTPFTPTM